MNEILFFIHISLLIGLGLVATKFGKEALMSFSALQALLANLFIQKQTYLFGLEVTCTDPYSIGSFLTANLVQEYYGKESAKKLMYINFFLLATFALMAKLHLYYIPSIHDTAHPSFFQILNNSPRIIIASFSVFFFVQKLDVELFSRLRARYFPNSLFMSLFASLIITQVLDTTLFTFLALYGIAGSLWHIIIMSLSVKILVIFLMAPFSRSTKKVIDL